MNIKLVGIDLAKTVFQVCAMNQANKPLYNKKMSRSKLINHIAQLEPTLIVMEACGSANYWARKFTAMGHTVKLIPAQHVKPFVKRNKNDSADALAICEAALRPEIHFVPAKTTEQLDIQMLHRIRQQYVKHSTALASQIRAFLRENGLNIPRNKANLTKHVPSILEDGENELTLFARALIDELYEDFKQAQERVRGLDLRVKQVVANNEECQRLISIPGYGPVISTALVAAIGNGSQFNNGRQCSAWAGLTPRHTGTGGKTKMLASSKAGNLYLRYLLIHGARTVLTWCKNKTDRLSMWIKSLIARRGKHKAIVALANKCLRIAWVLLTRKETYQLKGEIPTAV